MLVFDSRRRLATSLDKPIIPNTLKESINDLAVLLRVVEPERHAGFLLQQAYVIIMDYAEAHARAHTNTLVSRPITPTTVAATPAARQPSKIAGSMLACRDSLRDSEAHLEAIFASCQAHGIQPPRIPPPKPLLVWAGLLRVSLGGGWRGWASGSMGCGWGLYT